MSLPSLFMPEHSENGDLALTKLPTELDLWPETIVTKVKEKLPAANAMVIKVSFVQKNEELGIATGAVTIFNQKMGKSVYIPLIIKDFRLCPLDVMIIPKQDVENGMEVIPLTRDNYEESMFNTDVFDHLERPVDRIQQLYLNPQNTVVYPPYFRNVYASANILNAISGTIDPADKAEMLKTIQDNPRILHSYQKNANFNLIQKIAEEKVVPSELPEGPVNVALLKKDMKRGLQIFYTADEVFNPLTSSCDNSNKLPYSVGDAIKDKDEAFKEVRRNGEYIVFNDLHPVETAMVGPLNNPENYTDSDGRPSEVLTFGKYKVFDKTGLSLKGVVIPNVIDFNQKPIRAKLFYAGTKCAYQDLIIGDALEGSPRECLKYCSPEIGMTGVFVATNEKNAIATIPFTIRSVYESQGYQKIVAEDINGKKLKLKYGVDPSDLSVSSDSYMKNRAESPFSQGVELQQIVFIKDFYLIPERFKFLPLVGFCELRSSLRDVLEKEASFKMDVSPVRVIHTGASQFSLKGPDIAKMASKLNWDATNLSPAQTVFLLASKRCPLVKVASAMKEAGMKGESAIHGLPNTMFPENAPREKVAKAKVWKDYVRGLRVNLVKEAAGIEDAHIVDAALSLNFINDQNVDKFLNFVPHLDECAKMLAQCLLASRLGMSEIPEQDAQTAMYKITNVVKGLKRLDAHQEA